MPPKYTIYRLGLKPFVVEYEGVPPCLWCGRPVERPSMDGPLVCACCDMGVDWKTKERWTSEVWKERHDHRAAEIDRIAALPENNEETS